MRLSPFTLPLLLHVAGLLLVVLGLPPLLEGSGGIRAAGWLVPVGSAALQAVAIFWLALRYRRHPQALTRTRYLFYFVLQNLGLWPVVALLLVLAAR